MFLWEVFTHLTTCKCHNIIIKYAMHISTWSKHGAKCASCQVYMHVYRKRGEFSGMNSTCSFLLLIDIFNVFAFAFCLSLWRKDKILEFLSMSDSAI